MLTFEDKILNSIISRFRVKGTQLIDYNKTIKMMSMMFKIGYNPAAMGSSKMSIFDKNPASN